MKNRFVNSFKNFFADFRWQNYINYLVIAAALVLFLILDVCGALKYGTANMLTQIGYSIVLAVSLNLVVGFLGELSLGHAGFMCVGAYVGGLLYNFLIPSLGALGAMLVSLPVGGLLAAAFGFLIGLPALRLKGDYLAIVTLAFGEIVRTVALNSGFFGPISGMTSVKFGKQLYILAFIIAILTVAVAQNLRRSKHGRAIQAIRDNEIAARAMGVNVTYYKLAVFVIAAFFAGIAGVLYSGSVSLVQDDQFSFNYSIDILVMVVLGGMGNITGSIFSSAFLVFVKLELKKVLPSTLAAVEPLIYALILIFVVMWNNAPAIRPFRERVYGKVRALRDRIFPPRDGGNGTPETAEWDRVPTKIPMDALLSTDFTVDRAFEADIPDRKEVGDNE